MAIIANLAAGLLLAILVWRAVVAQAQGDPGARDDGGTSKEGARE